AARSGERRDGAVAAALVVRGRAPLPGRGKSLEAGQIVVEAQVEIDTLHLAVADQVGVRLELVGDGQPHRVADGLVAVLGAEPLRMAGRLLAEVAIPARERPAADDRRRDQGEFAHGCSWSWG